MAEKSLKQKTIYGMIWVGVQKFGTLFITFISNIILARLLTPDDYGMVGMLAIFIAISNTLIDAGLGSALIQKTKPTQEDYTTVFYWNIFFSIFIYGILFFSAPLIEKFYKDIHGLSLILRVQGVVILINALTIVQFNQLRKSMNFKMLAKINVVSALTSVIIAIACALLGLGVWTLVIQQMTLSISNITLLSCIFKWKPKGGISLTSLKNLFGFGSYIMFSGILNTLATNINGLLIGKFFSASTLGYFSQAKKLEDVSSIGILSVVEQVTYPLLVEVKNNYGLMINVLKRFNVILLALTLPLMYAMIIMAYPIIVILFSEKWLPSVPILQILAVAGIFICMQGANYNAIAAIGKSKTLFNWTVIKRILNIGILLVTLLIWGFDGLLWGIVLTAATIALFNMYLVAKHIGYGLWDQIRDLLPIIIISTITFIPCYYFSNISSVSITSTHLMLYNVISGLIYIIGYIILICLTPIKSIQDVKHEISISFLRRFRHNS